MSNKQAKTFEAATHDEIERLVRGAVKDIEYNGHYVLNLQCEPYQRPAPGKDGYWWATIVYA